MRGMSGALELLKQSRPGQFQRFEVVLEHSFFRCWDRLASILLTRFAFLYLIGDGLTFPPTSHNSVCVPQFNNQSSALVGDVEGVINPTVQLLR
jgi:hypothetical protein